MTSDGAMIGLSLSVLLWLFRLRFGRHEVWSDFKWILVFALWAGRGSLWDLIASSSFVLNNLLPLRAFAVITLLAIPLACALYFLFKARAGSDAERIRCGNALGSVGLKPVVFPSRTTHTRFFPKKHSFSYSYLLVGVPIGCRGAIGSLLSVDEGDIGNATGPKQRAWLSVNATDYLHRGFGARGLKGKLEDFLKTKVKRTVSRINFVAEMISRMKRWETTRTRILSLLLDFLGIHSIRSPFGIFTMTPSHSQQ